MIIKSIRCFSRNQLTEQLLIFFICLSLFDYLGTGQYFGYIITFIVLFFRNSKISNLKYFIWLILFGSSYSIINYLNFGFTNGVGEFVRILIFPSAYFFAASIITRNKSASVIIVLILIFMISYSFRALFSIVFEILQNGFLGSERNIEVFGFSGEDSTLNSTNLFAQLSLNVSCISFLFLSFVSSYEKYLKLILIFLCFISLFSSLRIGSRTGLVILLFSFLVVVILNFNFFESKEKYFLYFFLIFLILVFIFLYRINFLNFDLFKFYLDRVDSDDFSASSAGGRTELWSYYLNKIPEYPFGNIPPESNNYGSQFAHNLWLDVAKKTGIIPLLFLIALFIQFFRLLFNSIRTLNENKFLLNLIISINISFLSVFFVEPVLEGMYFHFIFFIIILGILSKYLSSIESFKQ